MATLASSVRRRRGPPRRAGEHAPEHFHSDHRPAGLLTAHPLRGIRPQKSPQPTEVSAGTLGSERWSVVRVVRRRDSQAHRGPLRQRATAVRGLEIPAPHRTACGTREPDGTAGGAVVERRATEAGRGWQRPWCGGGAHGNPRGVSRRLSGANAEVQGLQGLRKPNLILRRRARTTRLRSPALGQRSAGRDAPGRTFGGIDARRQAHLPIAHRGAQVAVVAYSHRFGPRQAARMARSAITLGISGSGAASASIATVHPRK